MLLDLLSLVGDCVASYLNIHLIRVASLNKFFFFFFVTFSNDNIFPMFTHTHFKHLGKRAGNSVNEENFVTLFLYIHLLIFFSLDETVYVLRSVHKMSESRGI